VCGVPGDGAAEGLSGAAPCRHRVALATSALLVTGGLRLGPGVGEGLGVVLEGDHVGCGKKEARGELHQRPSQIAAHLAPASAVARWMTASATLEAKRAGVSAALPTSWILSVSR